MVVVDGGFSHILTIVHYWKTGTSASDSDSAIGLDSATSE